MAHPVLLVLLMLVPIAIFRLLRRARAAPPSRNRCDHMRAAQIAHVSAALVEEHFRQSTAFLESIATRRTFREAWVTGD